MALFIAGSIATDHLMSFGGKFAAFDPLANLRVGVKVLKDCIQMAGSVEGGLRYYVGAANLESDNGYAEKVMIEYGRLQQVATGRSVPLTSPQTVTASWPSAKILRHATGDRQHTTGCAC